MSTKILRDCVHSNYTRLPQIFLDIRGFANYFCRQNTRGVSRKSSVNTAGDPAEIFTKLRAAAIFILPNWVAKLVCQTGFEWKLTLKRHYSTLKPRKSVILK